MLALNIRNVLTIITVILVGGLFLAPHDTVTVIQQFINSVISVFHGLNLH